MSQAQPDPDQLKDELAHLSRVMALAELCGHLAHELNQPLAAILINAEAALGFLEPQKLDLDEVRAILKDIIQDNQRAADMIEKVRDSVRPVARLGRVDINDVVRAVVSMVRGDLEKQNIGLEIALADNLPKLEADPLQLQHLLLNLVTNASDAMMEVAPHLRKLTIRTEPEAEAGVQLSVSDRGPGIPPRQMEQIFEPFFTTRQQRTGLGLTVCLRIAAAHGGRLCAISEPGNGTTFHLLLPQTKAAG